MPPAPPDLIGQSRLFLDALEHASRVAEIDRPILVVGERGSGKELFAGRIHYLSPRWDGPLVKVNCAAMNDELLDSELFGHEAGAFTGATKKHKGRFERAEGGTLFLDEIASASLRVQEKLLRVIEYGEYERVGGDETRTANVRVVAAANVDLRQRAEDGAFRADLLDRLAFDVVAAPPLRERREDIPLLAAHFAGAVLAELGAPHFPGFAPEALRQLQMHHWPGNVRELKNAAERAAFLWAAAEGDGQIDDIVIDPFERAHGKRTPSTPEISADSPMTAPARPADVNENGSIDLRAHLDQIEKTIAEAALARQGGNQRRTAQALSLSYDQMRGIVRKYGLS